jgi:hypothetical protein
MFSQVAHPIELRRLRWRRTILSVSISLLCAAAWTPSEAVPPGIYEISKAWKANQAGQTA